MKRMNLCYTIICMAVALAALGASARTVYDAGKAFNEAGHNVNSFGAWSFLHASGDDLAATAAFDTTTGGTSPLVGIGGSSSPWIRVNTSSETQMSDGEEVLPGELYLHPGNPSTSNPYDVIRFTAPEAGWYSACIFAHDVSRETSRSSDPGVDVSIRVAGTILISKQRVALEDYAGNNPTQRFDFQMPVRRLNAGDCIEVVVGPGTAHPNDATGLRFVVTKEDEGAFYDSGLAMMGNVAASPYANPYGTIASGTWYFLTATAPAAQTAPKNVSEVATSRITTEATVSTYLKGVANASNGQSPFVLVNTASSTTASVVPGELKVHHKAGDSTRKTWTALRFRPPESGYYSASIVARDVDRADMTMYPSADGVDVYLYIADTLVTNAYVSLETKIACSARFTFDSRLMAAGEPVDIVVSPHGEIHNDATGISAIFRREPGDVYDAGRSFYSDHANGGAGTAGEYADLLGGGATWRLGAKTNAWCGAQFYDDLVADGVASGSKTKWWLQGRFMSYSEYPYFLMITNGVASADSAFGIVADLLAATPYEFVAVPNTPGYQSSSPTIKATVPADGVYRVRAYARDLNNGGGDGVRGSVAVNNYIVASAEVRRGTGQCTYEAALGADRLWLKAGDRIEYVIDPLTDREYDPTGLSACYERTGDATARVINIDITGSNNKHIGAGREGWRDWNKWNYMRFSGSVAEYSPTPERTLPNCREADGTRRNVAFTLAHDSGAVIAKGSGSGGSALHNIWASSTDPGDTYTFTLSRLKPSARYTLYLYSAKGAATGNGAFTVGDVTRGADELWNLRDVEVVARFYATSDANGILSGTFAAADGNGGAFNGLTVVGEFPDYIPLGTTIILR